MDDEQNIFNGGSVGQQFNVQGGLFVDAAAAVVGLGLLPFIIEVFSIAVTGIVLCFFLACLFAIAVVLVEEARPRSPYR